MKLPHIMIRASAGSGKTYALTNRFVALLAAGAAPERIVALTFTRKAAGEFFDEILRKLAAAASDGRRAAALAREIGRPEMGGPEFLRLLRIVAEAMPRLQLGTLDAFFARVARAFPFELGLGGEFAVLQEHAELAERRRVLSRMFARSAEGPDGAQREFIEAFKQATFGVEEKNLAASLDNFIGQHHAVLLTAPDAAAWGAPERIWPAGAEWLPAESPKIGDAIAVMRAQLSALPLTDKQGVRFEAFLAALAEWQPGAPWPPPIDYIVKNALEVWADLQRGAADITVERKRLALPPPACAALMALVRHVVGGELRACLTATRGIRAVLQAFEDTYDAFVRRAGRLTFGDVQRMLEPAAGGLWNAVGRTAVNYRLDGQIDHWLLDEFQDTSLGQWSVLEELIDEAVQDPSGGRSFFCVGDVKQGIYAWRDGERRLFDAVLERYNSGQPGTIAEEHLSKSWRSAPAVIEMVNAVFGSEPAIARLLPGEAGWDWNRDWRAHESAHPRLAGQAAWLHAGSEEARHELTLRIIAEIAPMQRGLSCAVLTRTNQQAADLADRLRAAGISAVAESELRIATDNPLGAVLLALAQVAAHPGDTFARRHVEMSPLHGLLRAEGWRSPAEISRRWLAQVHDMGFEGAMGSWLQRLEKTLSAADRFSRERGRQFLAASALFDATGGRDVAEFVAFMENHAARENEAAGVVRVMTIHRAKGLGFDVVVLPELEGQAIDQARDGLAVSRDADRAVDWVLSPPRKLIREADAVLALQLRAAEATAGHEALSLLYVAMTRAKRAMYLVTSRPGASESRNYPRLLADTLGNGTEPVEIGVMKAEGGVSRGDPNWHAGISPVPVASRDIVPVVLDIGRVRPAARRRAVQPSADRAVAVEAARLFVPQDRDAAEFGRAVHELLAEIEWSGAGEAPAWRSRGIEAAVTEEATACLAAEALADVWKRPERGEVWRERAFEVVLDDVWMTGVFDRVVVERAADGSARRATVFDFKTERLPAGASPAESAARHAAQLRLYRRAVMSLTGLPADAVDAQVVFTALRQLVRVTPA